MERKFKTIGLLRFSVLTPTYYAERFSTLQETAAHIFSDTRMALRFRIFETLCLPTLANQTDSDFDMIVLTAESMPPVHLERLLDLLDPYPHIHCLPVGTDNHYKLLQNGYNSISRDGITHRILFRLDDDDAVDLNFVKRTKRMAKGLARFQNPREPFAIAQNKGFYVRTADGGANGHEIFDAIERAPLSTGTALVAPARHGHNPYRFNHRKLAQHYNTYQDMSVPAYIRTIHGDNKSNPTQMGLTHKMDEAAIAKDIQTHFGFTLDDLRTL